MTKTPKIPEVVKLVGIEAKETEEKKTDQNLAVVLDKHEPLKDAGQFTEHHSFSPARPAPTKHSMITTTPGQISKLRQSKIIYKPTQLPAKTQNMNFQ